MKIIGLIQARMASTRLPGKVLLPLVGKPVLWHISNRMNEIVHLDEIVIATTMSSENDAISNWAQNENIQCVRHPKEDDIAGRLMLAINETNADAIVKINADCPLFDPKIAGQALELFLQRPAPDAATNKLKPTYPLGMSVEVLGRDCLSWCYENLSMDIERELTVKWIFDRPQKFRIRSLEQDKRDDSHYNLTLDTPQDYNLISRIYEHLYQEDTIFGWNDIRNYLISMPELSKNAFLPQQRYA